MNFLSALLPNLRDVRAPAVVGGIYALIFWLLLGPDVLFPVDPPNIAVARFQALESTFGRAPALAVGSLAAFLVGSMSLEISLWIWKRANDASRDRAANASHFPMNPTARELGTRRPRRGKTPSSASERGSRRSAVVGALRHVPGYERLNSFFNPETLDRRIFGLARDDEQIIAWLISRVSVGVSSGLTLDNLRQNASLAPQVQESLRRDSELMTENAEDAWTHVQEDNPGLNYAAWQELYEQGEKEFVLQSIVASARTEVLEGEFPTHLVLLRRDDPLSWNEYDRLRAEHELRVGLVAPLVLLGLVVALLGEPWWAAGVLLAAPLFVQGSRLGRRAEGVVWGSLIAGTIRSHTVAEIERQVRSL